MFKKLILAAAALAISAPVLADPHRKSFERRHADRGQHQGHRHVARLAHRPVVVMPPPRVYYAPPPRVYYAPPPRVIYAPALPYSYYRPAPVYRPVVPHGGISIGFNIPF